MQPDCESETCFHYMHLAVHFIVPLAPSAVLGREQSHDKYLWMEGKEGGEKEGGERKQAVLPIFGGVS